ncbi:MAG: hypothetical protein DI533_09470 [Cereibacter sphaeroides]|uniref:Endonuclease GajA/Old nuclease/RecF-like AAA domain-containing protein n=1 Tax=Cereibacter sphaeroides TaxID=1063 RepID=A0A2W5USL3_CERSP|nr:MAG: hypothetical protein DI533_09470 [Cereibacter sphaeroides]
MRYRSFTIKNFKGIKNTTVDFSSAHGANVFAFVGLNESGKTTILEAIHSFSPDRATGELLGGELGVPFSERVPRHQISSFTADISVAANIEVTERDWRSITAELSNSHGLLIDTSRLPQFVVLDRHQRFQNGDFKESFFTLRTELHVRVKRQTKWRPPSVEEQKLIRTAIFNRTPDIAYFPTFIFDFPESFYLTNRGSNVDKFYRQVFQDILDFDGKGLTVDRDIVRRVRAEERRVPWLNFLSLWSTVDDREKIQHVMDRAGAAATSLIFGKWNKIFGEDTKGKEIVLNYEIIEGEIKDAKGVASKTNDHDVKVTFQIRDRTRRFNVNDRSLGFRWFFSFMLFTQFRVARSASRPLLFLFDEPASNLHAAAQQKLIESFPEVAKNENCLAYSTHSHYMIEPKWLEQTFIVTNRAESPEGSVLDDVSLDDESLDIKVQKYRQFSIEHSNQTSYFQPILDRLEVVPSRFDFKAKSVIVEGKSDYYILRYGAELHKIKSFSIIPGMGAGSFGALVALSVGWNLDCLFILDGDKKGKQEARRYVDEYCISPKLVKQISELMQNMQTIEDLVDESAREIIASELELDGKPDKGQIRRFFQERLASNNVKSVSKAFDSNIMKLISEVSKIFP